MPKISLELEPNQLKKALTQLGPREQLRLAKQLAASQMDRVVVKLRRTVREKRLSMKDIEKIVEQVRSEVHHRSRN